MNLQLIRSFNPQEKVYKPDWDDTAIDFTFSNGLTLTGFTQINNQSTETDCLEGLDGFLYIDSIEQLESLISKSFEQVLEDIKKEDDSFPIDDYI